MKYTFTLHILKNKLDGDKIVSVDYFLSLTHDKIIGIKFG